MGPPTLVPFGSGKKRQDPLTLKWTLRSTVLWVSKDRDRTRGAVRASSTAKLLEGLSWELQELGVRPYAARLLVALLRSGSGTSAQLAELSGVPRTSVYKVMGALAEQGLVEAVPTFGPAAWTCPGWEVVVDILDAAEEQRLCQHHERTQRLRRELAHIFPAKLSA